jgi:hypothetical protein
LARGTTFEIEPALSDDEEPTSVKPNITELPWGTEHPQFGRETSKIKWTPIEIWYVGDWMVANGHGNNDGKLPSSKVQRSCRNSLIDDYPEMIPHFHRSHVVKMSTFAHGYNRYLEEQRKIQERIEKKRTLSEETKRQRALSDNYDY